MTNLSGIQPHEVSQVWPFIEEMLSEALVGQESSWRLDDIAHALGRGEMQLWLATSPERQIEAVAITRLTERGCSICAVTGQDPDRWISLLPTIERWAASLDQKRVYFEGRKGWVKKMPDYRVIKVIMEKDLTHGRI